MKNLRFVPTMVGIVVVLACVNTSVSAQSAISEDRRIAAVNSAGLSVRWDMTAPATTTLTISSPDGRVFSREFGAGTSPEFTLMDQGERLPDGQYFYEIRVHPALSSATKKSLALSRGKDDDTESVRASRKRADAGSQNLVQSGGFMVVNGTVVVGGIEERGKVEYTPVKKPLEVSKETGVRGAALTKIRQHHMAFAVMPDQVIPDDLIVQGSICAGLDCVNGEVFGFDTVRLKENNTRLQFDDTSGTGFPTNNWQIRANSSAGGGGSFLAFVDQGATGNSETGTIVFEVDAGAPANSLRVSSTGRVGIKTAVPTLDLHINTSDTPAIRLEQNNSGGFSAQTWDIAGNEANFFVRDVTSGSRLPFRIRPGAPTSSLDIAADGEVGVGTASPNGKLHILGAAAATVNNTQILRVDGNITNGLDFGVLSGSPFTLWMQARDNTNTGITYPLSLNPSGGNVGVGTTAPDQRFSVNGEASKAGGGAWLVFSDERLKNIKGNFNSGLKALMQLQPLRYEYRSDNALGLTSPGEHIGFGARALQKVIPEAVTNTSTGYLQVNNDPIIWTMLNAIKEQQQEIEKLKQEVRQLRATSRKRR
ncbi:MAG TPA: tail fiber domain-containing protein [Pyrinomonadaceae bacterium]|nr:tail fiber domain-containing protein [Pyrinomonadaceae bacterium]